MPFEQVLQIHIPARLAERKSNTVYELVSADHPDWDPKVFGLPLSR